MTGDPVAGMMGDPVAVFPLGSVLLPGQLLSLHVFEPRFRVLVFDVTRAEEPDFGVVLIERGSEVGGGEVRTDVGCMARVLRVEEQPDGRYHLVAVGTRPFAVREWLEDDPYPRARVEVAAPGDWSAVGEADLDALRSRARSVAALASELGAPPWPAELELSADPDQLVWQLALLTPLATLDRQMLLAAVDPSERTRLLDTFLTDQREMLEARLAWGADGP